MITARNDVLRALPHRERRMVAAWCFVDVFGPTDVDGQPGMAVPLTRTWGYRPSAGLSRERCFTGTASVRPRWWSLDVPPS
jgi:hypothetical protein